MSLPIAARGEKAYLQHAWSARKFDFELACRRYGRNDAFWTLCYRRRLDGDELPDEREAKKFVTRANRATGGLNRQGERERYTLYEATATIDQVARYRGVGLKPLLAKRRRWSATSRSRRAISPTRRLLEAVCDVAQQSGCATFSCSHRRLAALVGVDRSRIAYLLRDLEQAGQVFRRGFTPAQPGRTRGTTILSLKPSRPAQRIDEVEPPTWDCKSACWSWTTPLAKGTITQASFRRALARGGYVPNVSDALPRRRQSAFETVFDVSTRGSPPLLSSSRPLSRVPSEASV